MRILRLMLVATFTLSFHITISAADENTPFSVQQFPDLPISKTSTIAEAKRIQKECERILALVPRLSPTEEVWLKGELDAHRDMENLSRRPEYARNALYVHFYDCVTQSRLAAESLTEKDRTIAWTMLVSRFSASIDLKYWSEHVGSAELIEPVKRFAAWERLNTYKIVDEVVLPYLLHSK